MRSIPFARAGVLVGLLAFVSVAVADEVKIELKDVPKAVLDAVKAKFPKAELTGATKETEEGKTTYEIALKDKGQKVDVALTADGKITEIETEIAARDLPEAVSSALEAKYPKATIKKAELITEIDGAKESKNYEVVVVTEAKKSLEVKVSPEGKILKEDGGGEDKD
ncbi:MAG: PepSY-like domain-containing protein [Isosphaerales bacterium]